MTRRHLDFYPTPPDAARALIEHMRAVCPWMLGEGIPESEEARHRWLDPAAGCGALLREIKPHVGETVALELDGCRAALAADVADVAKACDSLAEPWPASCVIANPPFNMLDQFVEKIVRHVERHQTWAAVLVRVQWLDDGQGRHERFRPSQIWRMPWRLRFINDASDATTHSWLIYGGEHSSRCEVSWLERPAISDDEWHRHWVEADQIDAIQGSLW